MQRGRIPDCLLQRGARGVVAIDTGYGVLAWKLRNDDRVEVRERTNALHADPPDEPLDLVVIDLAWTPQRLALPAARGGWRARGTSSPSSSRTTSSGRIGGTFWRRASSPRNWRRRCSGKARNDGGTRIRGAGKHAIPTWSGARDRGSGESRETSSTWCS